MSTTYEVRQGDTFETVARRRYGSEGYASVVASANPGVTEPLSAGALLTVPPRPEAPKDVSPQSPSAGEDEVAVTIDGVRFRFWSDLNITRSLDNLSTLTFSAPFDSAVTEYRQTFRPFSYKPVEVTVGGEPLFTGTIIDVRPSVSPLSKVIEVSAYSTPGVLNDCTAPASLFSLEFDNASLSTIAATLCAPFGIGTQFDAEPGPAFERIALPPPEKILRFLADLARQRNQVIGDTEEGSLLFQTSTEPGAPAATLAQGLPPLMSVDPSFNPQEYYSSVTGLEPVLVGTLGSQYTTQNPRLPGVLRPLTFEVPDVEGGDIQGAVEAKMARVFGNMVTYRVRVNTWRDPAGQLWQPNTTIKLTAPDAMIYSAYEFIIRSVRFDRSPDRKEAELVLVLPGAFSGQIPETLPWD